MSDKVSIFKQYPSTFWVGNVMEIFERMGWYGFFALSTIYITGAVSDGCLGFTSEDRGVLQGVVGFFVYLLPFLTGALADRFGFKKMLIISYLVLSPAYFLLGYAKTFSTFFAVFMLVGIGAAIFKPLVVGTIAKTTNKKNSSLGFGIFYMMVNVGALVGPIISAILRTKNWQYVFVASSIYMLINIPIVIFFYKEPPRDESQSSKPFKQVMSEMVDVIGNLRFFIYIFIALLILVLGSKILSIKELFLYSGIWLSLNLILDLIMRLLKAPKLRMKTGNVRFLLFLLLLSSFWVAFNQIFLTLPEYIRDFSNTSVALNSICQFFTNIHLPESIIEPIRGFLGEKNGSIKPEHIININALAIIFFQILVSLFVARMKPLITIIVGIAITAGSFFLLILGVNPWIAMLGVFIFSFGEMMASPKAKEYTAHYVAPQDKIGTYMGYYMWCVALGNLFGGILSGKMYGWLARDLQRPDLMWMFFAFLSIFCAVLLLIYHKTIGVKVEKEQAAQQA